MTGKRVSVVILNWNGLELLKRFLPQVVEKTPSDLAEIVVADNGSSDDSVEWFQKNFPQVRAILFDKNYGFAEGYNRAIKEIKSEFVVLLNSDVEPSNGWLQPLLEYADEHTQVVALQPKIRDWKRKDYFEYAGAAGGFLDFYGLPFCRGRMLNTIEKDTGQYDTPLSIHWATGACLFIRTKDYIDAGGLDASFFAHMEEVDLCWRLRARGKEIFCIPTSVVYHVGGATLAQGDYRKLYLNYRNNLLMMYKNLSSSMFLKKMLVRWGMDFLAFIHLLLLGKVRSAFSVVRAYCSFMGIRHKYKEEKKKNLSLSIGNGKNELSPHSLIWEYYIKRKMTFSLWK